MDISKESQLPIFFPKVCWETIIEHCHRKLAGKYLATEPMEKKAYGIVAGKKMDDCVKVEKCFPLLKNARDQEVYKDTVNDVMGKHAIPSETPLSKRGWVADSDELHAIIGECRKLGITIIGSYHMHRVAWEHDALRETPTKLDAVMAEKSRLSMFIISVVNPDRPVIRAFYEGLLEKEQPLHIVD